MAHQRPAGSPIDTLAVRPAPPASTARIAGTASAARRGVGRWPLMRPLRHTPHRGSRRVQSLRHRWLLAKPIGIILDAAVGVPVVRGTCSAVSVRVIVSVEVDTVSDYVLNEGIFRRVSDGVEHV